MSRLCAFDEARSLCASISTEKRVLVWDVVTNSIRGRLVDDVLTVVKPTCLVWGSGSSENVLYVGTSEGTVLKWVVSLGKVVGRFSPPESHGRDAISDICVARDTGVVFTLSSVVGEIVMWNPDGACTPLRLAKRKWNRITASADGTLLVACDLEIRLFDVPSQKQVGKAAGHTSQVKLLKFSRNGDYLFSSSGDGYIWVWCVRRDLMSPRKLLVTPGVVGIVGAASCFDVSSPSKIGEMKLVVGTQTKSVHILVRQEKEASQQQEYSNRLTTSVDEPVLAVSIVSDGSEILVCSGVSMAKLHFSRVSGSGVKHDEKKVLEEDLPEGPDEATSIPKQSVLGTRDLPLPGQGSKPDGAEEEVLSFEAKLARMNPTEIQVAPKPLNIESAASLHLVLAQALQSSDTGMIESCLAHQRLAIVNQTVAELPLAHVSVLLEYVVGQLSAKPHRGSQLVVWLRAVLSQHTAYLLSVPSVSETLTPLYQVLESRLSHYRSLSRLSGRIDLILAQAKAQRKAAAAVGPPARRSVFRDGDSERISLADAMRNDVEMENDEDSSGDDSSVESMEDAVAPQSPNGADTTSDESANDSGDEENY